MRPIRIIARLDVKGPNLIKGVNLEGLKIIGNPNEHAVKYYCDGIDEIIYMDTVASLYGRNNLKEILTKTVNDVFIPITVGGGVRSVEDAYSLLLAGADKIAVNTAAVDNPNLISNIAKRFGSQCMVISIEAKRVGRYSWEVYTNNGRERSGLSVVRWVQEAIDLGAGEVLLTSIDNEGTRKGFELDLVEAVSNVLKVPLIVSGGMGKPNDLVQAVEKGADAVAIADILHYSRYSLNDIKKHAISHNINIRPTNET